MHTLHLSSVDSTNQYAKEHSKSFPKGEISCVFADEQTKGRGRYQRSWLSSKGQGLYVTFYFTLPIDTLHLISLAQLAVLSLVKTLDKEHLPLEIKWPNDLRCSQKKMAGVLCETRFHPEEVEVFLGLGVNLNFDEEMLLALDQPATSLFVETKKKWDPSLFLKDVQSQLVQDLALFKKRGFTPFHQAFDQLLAFKGQVIQCYDGKKVWTGICHSLTEDGQLNLLLENKTLHTVLTGDIKK